MALADLINPKWQTGIDADEPQKILLEDLLHIEDAIIESATLRARAPALTWVDTSSVKVEASADSPARIMMVGFPNILHPSQVVAGGSDGRYRVNTTQTVMDVGNPACLWGTEKESQWWAIFAIARAADAVFTIKAMPWMRVKSQAGQIISLGTLADPSGGIGYGFTANELAGAYIYMLSGSSAGLLRAITANNNNNTTGGTITYGGAALTVAEGDWCLVLPAVNGGTANNFRWLADVFNAASGDLLEFRQRGSFFEWVAAQEITCPEATAITDIRACPPLARCFFALMTGYGAGGTPDVSENIYLKDTNSDWIAQVGTVLWDSGGSATTAPTHHPAMIPSDFCQYKGQAMIYANAAQVVLKSYGWEYDPARL